MGRTLLIAAGLVVVGGLGMLAGYVSNKRPVPLESAAEGPIPMAPASARREAPMTPLTSGGTPAPASALVPDATLSEPRAPSSPPLMPPSSTIIIQQGRLTVAQAAAFNDLQAKLDLRDESVDDILDPLRDWAARNPMEASQWVADNLEGGARSVAMDEVISIWAGTSPQDALNWLDAQQNVGGLEDAYSSALSGLAHASGLAAAEWLKIHPGQFHLNNWQIIFSTWGQVDESQALRWVQNAQLTAGMRDALLPTLLASFQNPALSQQLLASANPALTDNALIAAAKSTRMENPAFSLGLARNIKDETARAQAVTTALEQWMKTDPVAAQAHASSSQPSPPVTR